MTRYYKVCMIIFVVAAAGSLQSNAAMADSALIYNGASHDALCILVNFQNDNVGYNKFVIPTSQYKRVDIGTKVRCSVDIDPGKSSTWLNYFVTDLKGVYTLMMQIIPYGQGTRYATLVTFDKDKRIEYTVTNATALPVQLLFLPNKNTVKLASGEKTACNSPIRNGEFPVVQASSPTGSSYHIPISKQGCNYKIMPYGQYGQGIVIVPEKK